MCMLGCMIVTGPQNCKICVCPEKMDGMMTMPTSLQPTSVQPRRVTPPEDCENEPNATLSCAAGCFAMTGPDGCYECFCPFVPSILTTADPCLRRGVEERGEAITSGVVHIEGRDHAERVLHAHSYGC